MFWPARKAKVSTLTGIAGGRQAAVNVTRAKGGPGAGLLIDLFIGVMALLISGGAMAQTTSGNPTAGLNLWNDFPCGGCHAVTGRPQNAADAGGHILYATAHGMPASVTATEANDLAAYIGFNLATPTIFMVPGTASTSFPLPGVTLNSTFGKFTGINIISPPAKGAVTLSGTTATYTPNPGQVGADSFTWQAVVPEGCSGGCSSVRTQKILIGPANDNFFDAVQIDALHFSDTVNNLGATKESGEPAHAGNAGGHSVWWRWIPRNTFPATITTSGSNFNTLLGVYTGPDVAHLTLVAANDDCGSGCTPTNSSSVTFSASTNTPYYIAVDGFNGATGTIQFDLLQAIPVPPNDNYANATAIVPPTVTVSSANLGSTVEAGESPPFLGTTVAHSLWWKWTAPGTGVIQVNTQGSAGGIFGIFNHVVGVYKNGADNTIGNLVLVGSANNVSGFLRPTPEVTFQATAGVTYYFYVGTDSTTTGTVVVNLVIPGNDAYYGRLPLFGPDATATGNTVGTTLESGEPGSGSASVWFAWTPDSTNTIYVDTCGSSFDTILNVYSAPAGNESLASLTLVATNDNAPAGTCANPLSSRVQFNPQLISGGFLQPPNPYYIRLSGVNTAAGNYVLHITHQLPQTITFAAIANQVLGVVPPTLTATATSGLAVTFSSATPLTCSVTGTTMTLLSPGVCTIVASNAGNAGFYPAPDVSRSFNIAINAVTYTGLAYSRVNHTGLGNFDLALNAQPVNGAIEIEPRGAGNGGHVIVFRFSGGVYTVGAVTVTDANGIAIGGGVASAGGTSNEARVTLTGIPDRQRVTVSVAGVNNSGGVGGASAAVALGLMVGDVTRNRSVNAADLSAIKARMGLGVSTGNNFLFDLDANGIIDSVDSIVAKARSGRVLP